MIDFQKIPVSYGGHDYVAEFDADTLLKCQSAGVLGLTDKPIDFAFECFFWSIQKNHPFTTRQKAREFFEAVCKDEEYGPDAFSDITDEFVRAYSMLFTSKDRKGKAKKKFVALTSPEIKAPKI
jgi:hypothetical protein